MPTDSAATFPSWADPITNAVRRGLNAVKRISPEWGDALLYLVSALFALGTIYTSNNALYQVWGRMALSPFAFGALASAGLALFLRRARQRQADERLTARQHRRAWLARIVVAVCVFVGALAIPMGLEILWRFDGVPGSTSNPRWWSSRSGARTSCTGRIRTTRWCASTTP